MNNLHYNAIACYQNPFMAISLYSVIKIRGLDLQYFTDGHLQFIDWLLFLTISVILVISQSLRMQALKYDEPGKLSHYNYFSSVYQLLYETIIFNQT